MKTMEIKKEYQEWLSSWDTGVSSETIFSILTGIPVKRHDTPRDIADIGRCVRMLRRLPELRYRLSEVIDTYKAWMPFIDCWKELERLYDECEKFEALPLIEQQKMKRKKHFTSPNERAWDLMNELTCASRYLQGMRAQNSHNSWSMKPPQDF